MVSFFYKLRLLCIAKENLFHLVSSSAYLLYGRMLRYNAKERTGAVVLREEHVDDLNFADPQGISQIKCKDFAAKTWHTRLTYQWNQR